jgi:hypothetical protein
LGIGDFHRRAQAPISRRVNVGVECEKPDVEKAFEIASARDPANPDEPRADDQLSPAISFD